MKLKQLNNSYTNPLNGEAFKDTFITDGVLTDDPHNQKLKISFRLQQKAKEKDISKDGDGNPIIVEVEKIKTLSETTLIFDKQNKPTYFTKDGETKDLLVFLESGGQLDGSETIEIGYPSYEGIKEYILKDNIGDAVEVNPNLDDISKMMVERFVMEKVIINGEPIGNQFYFEKE